MVNQAVIVALPPALDPIRLAGDEEKHATILYFGDTASLPPEAKTTILESLATAASMFAPFSEETMGVERLGPGIPPALVAKLSGRCLSKIRDALQINPALVTYMDNGTHHPQYTPHVTLGYPDFQEEAELKKLLTSLYEVRFDRLGLWWGEERFEFDLGAKDRGMVRALSHEERLRVDDFLEHVTLVDSGGHAPFTPASSAAQKKSTAGTGKFNEESVKRDKQGQFARKDDLVTNALDEMWLKNWEMIALQIGGEANPELEKLVASIQAKYGIKADAAPPPEHMREISQQIADLLNTHAKKYTSPSGTRRIQYDVTKKGELSEPRVVRVKGDSREWDAIEKSGNQAARRAMRSVRKHSPNLGTGSGGMKFNPKATIDRSQIEDRTHEHDLDFAKKLLGMNHSDHLRVDSFLEHYGVKGMKWGVRRHLQKLPGGQARADYLAAKDAKWLAKVEKNPKLAKVSRLAAKESRKLTKELKRDYKDRGYDIKRNPLHQSRYDAELKAILEGSLDKASYRVHKFPPSRLSEVKIHRHPDGTISAVVGPRMNAKIVKQQGKIAKADRKREQTALKEARKTSKLDRVNNIANEATITSFALSDLLEHSAVDEDTTPEDAYNGLTFTFDLDAEGFVEDIRVPTEGGAMTHSEMMVGDFLAHYGVKGMRWGIRRNRDSGGGSSGGDKAQAKSDKKAQKDMDKMAVGSVVPVKNADGTTKLLLKKKDGTWRETYVSVDAEKHIRARHKEGHELSDRELKETLERARLIDNYNKMFGSGDHADLKRQVEELQLQKQYKDLKDELNPPKKTMVKKFIDGSEKAWGAYQTLDKYSGGALSKEISKNLKAAREPSDFAKKVKDGSTSSGPPGPKTKGFRRGKTPPAPWGSTPTGKSAPGPTSGPFRVNPNPAFKPKASGKPPIPNITSLSNGQGSFKNSDGSFRPNMFLHPDGSATAVRSAAQLKELMGGS